MIYVTFIFILILFLSSPSWARYAPTNKQPQTVRDLNLFPINGPLFNLSDLNGAVVFVMRSNECPLSEKQDWPLMEKKYSPKGVHFIYNYVGPIKKEESGKKDLAKFGFKGPYLIDKKQTIANALGARTVEEVFILTPERRIVYRGPLDNPHFSNTLKKVISGSPVTFKEIPTLLCKIDQPVIGEVFWRDIAPIVYNKCTVCHNPSGSGPINYLGYEDVVGRLSMFRHVIENNLMPPWNLDPNTGPWKANPSLTEKEKAMVLKWVDNRAPRNTSRKDLYQSKFDEKKVKKGIANFSPDYILAPPKPVRVSLKKAFRYKRIFFKMNFEEDKWVNGMKFISKPKVIHHVLILILNESFKPENKSDRYKYLLHHVDGITKQVISDEVGFKIPKKATLMLEIHYEPLGKEIVDGESQVQISFNKNKPKYKITNLTFYHDKINIRPHQSDYQTQFSYKIKNSISVLQVGSHMHLRGKSSSIFIIDPNGERKRIFGLNPWNIKFERTYPLVNPLTIDKGSTIECINRFDNSKKNVWNPDPEKHVTSGDFIENEMSWCRFDLKYPIDAEVLNYNLILFPLRR